MLVTMGIKVEDHDSTPKLTLSKLPYYKPREAMQTPPLLPSVSIPFHWEEAPGKPRGAAPPSAKSKAARCLELPPRLQHDSPTTVLDGPYVGRSLCTFSFRKGPVAAEGKRNLGSGSFRERKFAGGSMDFSHSLGDMFRSEDNVKTTRITRRRTTINSKYLWGDIYATFKQAVPWRRSSP